MQQQSEYIHQGFNKKRHFEIVIYEHQTVKMAFIVALTFKDR